MRDESTFTVMFVLLAVCCVASILSGCISDEKQDLLLQTYADVVKEYEAERTDKVKLLELYKVANSDKPEVVAECEKGILESEESKARVGILSVIVEGLVESSTMDESQKALILEILDMVLPEGE